MATFAHIVTTQKMEGKEGLEALFDFATEGILLTNSNGEIIRINPAAEKLFRYDKNELLGKQVEVLVPKRLSGKHENHREKFSHNPHARAMGKDIELFGMRKDATEFPVEISLSPYSTDEGKFVIAFIVDITLRKQAAEKLRNYSAELEKQVSNRTLILQEAIDELEKTKANLKIALEREKELNELKSRFVSMASHEFRTPLATILSSLSLVKKYGEMEDIEKQNKHITRIKSSINNLTDILNDFLSASKLEEGRVENNPVKLNLKQFITEAISEMQTLVKAGQKIIYKHSGKEEALLDAKHFKNILFNLISNAIKFSGEDKPIQVTSKQENNSLKISVTDQGIGISKNDQEHLFERFFRGHNASYIQGTGLGLNIVAKYVEVLNGHIEFTSEEYKGTIFTLTFTQ
ncbi:MAG: PAS domain S-box protein [Bacteroidia bacterium]|nr:PAS domain S-box protein [Bacteroidia bacterium]